MPAVMPMREAVMLWRLERVWGKVSAEFEAGGWAGGTGGNSRSGIRGP